MLNVTRLVLPLLLLLGAALPAQSLAGQIAEIIGSADSGAISVWDAGLQLSDLEAQEDALSKAIVAACQDSGELGHLAAAAGLRQLAEGDLFGKDILDLVRPLAESESAAVRIDAVTMLSDSTLYNRRVMPEIADLLAGMVTDDLLAPQLRIVAARGLWDIGDEEARLASKRTLTDFLASRDRKLRIEAALVLAEINTDASGPGWDILREIADEPTPEGRLARSYLSREEERRLFNRRLREFILQKLDQEDGNTEDQFATLQELMLMVETQHIRGDEFDQDFLLESAARGLLQSLDRHSAYFSSDEFQRFFFDLNREYGGIGAFVNFDNDNVFSIVRPIYSGPAYGAGLKSGDKILEIDDWETAGHTSEEIISRLKGEPATDVKLKIIRPGLQEAKEVSVTRAQISVPSVNAELLPGDIGYVELVNFAQNTADELRKAVVDLQERGAVGLVLDLRNNTGGYLQAARDVVELFVPGRKLVVYTQGRDESERSDFHTRDRAVLPDIPLVVLINGYSASASEITAGALQDHGRATIVGLRSFGKGSVQQLRPLRTARPEPFEDQNRNGQRDDWEPYEDLNENGKYDVGPHVKLTVARYYLPSGRCLHKDLDIDGQVINPDWGVTPDTEIELREISVKDAWKNAEIFELFQQAAFQDYVRDRIEDNRELFVELAQGDGGDWSRYPDFEEFYAGLDTHLGKDDIRRWLRYQIRDEVADLRGKAFPGGRAVGDHQEDAQLQEAVRTIYDSMERDIREVPEYADVLKIDFETEDEDSATEKTAHK